jgi:glycosyltransferase involved in cell wall biosynthesis
MFGHGGIQTHTHYLAQGLTHRGHEVTVLSPPPMAREHRPLRKGGSYRLQTYAGNVSDILFGFASCKFGIPDVAVVCGTGWKAMLGTLSLPKQTRKAFFEVMSGKRIGRLDPRMLVHRGFDAIVGQGCPVEERFCREFSWKSRRTTIPALPEPLELAAEIRERHIAPPQGGVRLVYFGRLAAHKGLAFLLENWHVVDANVAAFDIYGKGPEEKRLAAMIAERSLGSKVRLLGSYPSGAHCVALMQRYDVKLLPTWGDEGAPLVLLEAMACGLPFVANGVGGIPDYRNPDCRITSGDLAEFLPALHCMITALRRGEINQARLQEHYRRHYSFSALVARWEAFLLELAYRPA